MALTLTMRPFGSGRSTDSFSLVLVLAFMAISFLIIAGLLSSTSDSARQDQRHQQFYAAREAATAAGELALAAMMRDLRAGGPDLVAASVATYAARLPTAGEAPEWGNYDFALVVEPARGWQYSELLWKYRGLSASNALYRVTTGAKTRNLENNLASVIRQEVQVASIPVFWFAALYDFDLSVITPPGNDVVLNGRVHGNRNLYLYPSGNLVVGDHVTAGQEIRHEQHPSDTATRTLGSVTYQGAADSQVNTLNLPLGTNDPHLLIEIPPPSESPLSYLGRQRVYYKADMILRVSDAGVLAYDQAGLTNGCWTNFVRTDAGFYDKRELKSVQATELDIEKLNDSYGDIVAWLGKPPRLIYVADLRTQGTETIAGVRLVKGSDLPAAGLTIATPNALYVKGDYNAPAPDLGTTNTLNAAAAGLFADALTILSDQWNDGQSTNSIGNRPAKNTTVNAAVLTGVIPSGPGVFDGGLFNALRLLENWSTRQLTFNGAIVVMFRSQAVLEPWRSSTEVYLAPVRKIGYDRYLLNAARLPPGTPAVCTLIRAEWASLPPDTLF